MYFSSVITVSQITVPKSQRKNAESIRMQLPRKIHAKDNLMRQASLLLVPQMSF